MTKKKYFGWILGCKIWSKQDISVWKLVYVSERIYSEILKNEVFICNNMKKSLYVVFKWKTQSAQSNDQCGSLS